MSSTEDAVVEAVADPEVVVDLVATHLHQLLLSMDSLDGFLDGLVSLAAEEITHGVSCGLTLVREIGPTTVATSDTRAMQVDEIQYSAGHGPCLSALRTQDVVLIDDLATDDRWPDFRRGAMTHGVGSVLSVPLDTGSGILGALNFYSTDAQVFGSVERKKGHLFASSAQRALLLAVRLGDQALMVEQLNAALASRATIDQAIGVIMAQNGCNADQAFSVLRGASQNRNQKIRDIAAAVLTAVGGERPPAPTFRALP